MTKVSWWKNRVKREMMGFIITKNNCKPAPFYIHEIMANTQNICREWEEIPLRNNIQEGFFREKESCLCVEDLPLTSCSVYKMPTHNKSALGNFVGMISEVACTCNWTPDPLLNSYSHIFSFVSLLSSQQPLCSVPSLCGDWWSFPARRWHAHMVGALQELPIHPQQVWTQLLGHSRAEVTAVRGKSVLWIMATPADTTSVAFWNISPLTFNY